ncbi:hypothetical protein B296_00031704 [Ensete ventricosum]|uniref:Ty3 transposon capsid-like protein domain-containing protein n=1 Tax=Ensete ventricosum TaxID=4639 RepID=A0A426ZWP0_ENSVE|nr:hypothetical protein B296_00031704 [Ensete ventricosum]
MGSRTSMVSRKKSYNWHEDNHGAPTWIQFKYAVLNHFGPTKNENINEELAKLQQTSMIQEYQTRFEELSYLVCDWTDRQLLGTFIEALKPKIKGEVKARQPQTVTTTISFARVQEEWLSQDAQRMRTALRLMTYEPPFASNHSSLPKKLTREELYTNQRRAFVGIAKNFGVVTITAKKKSFP